MSNERVQRLLIDTDPGVDDALALMMALAAPGVQVEAITVCAGNVGLAHTTRNALHVLELMGADVPVYAGCERPLVGQAPDAAFVHGRDGFGDALTHEPAGQARSRHAALALIEHSLAAPGELELVCLGPLSNLALALRLDPSLPQRLRRLHLMGGAITGRGNTLSCVEFNFGFDPEAAHIVVEAFPDLQLIDWEAVLAHGFGFDAFDSWLNNGDHRASFYRRIVQHTLAFVHASPYRHAMHIADALAMAVVLAPQIVTRMERRLLSIELLGEHTRGMSVVDWDRRSGRADNADLVMAVDQTAFEAMLMRALGVPDSGRDG